MKKFKQFEEFLNEDLNEAKRGTIHKAAKNGSYPAVVVVIENGKVIHQERVVSPEHAPAVFNVMQEKYPKAKLSLEDNTGQILFTEAADFNDPVLIAFRAAKTKREKELAKPKRKPLYGKQRRKAEDNLWQISQDLKDLYAERGQMLIDMEQEAEVEGGPIANEYGDRLNKIEDDIQKLITNRNKLEIRLAESVVNENIGVGKVVAIKKYNPKTNRYENMDVKITDYIKKPGSKDFVEYDLDGKKRKVSIDVFKSLMESVVNEAFYRMSRDTIQDELYYAYRGLTTYYEMLENGNDADPKELDDIIKSLKKCQSMTKKFNKPEDVKGTIYESTVTEKREDVGKYNTVKKVIAKLGRRPSEQDLAQFITDNYYDVTEVERGDDDPRADDKIADLVAFYKFDIDDWEIAWEDAQNESVEIEISVEHETAKIYHDKDFLGMQAQMAGMTREEWIAHYGSGTTGSHGAASYE